MHNKFLHPDPPRLTPALLASVPCLFLPLRIQESGKEQKALTASAGSLPKRNLETTAIESHAKKEHHLVNPCVLSLPCPSIPADLLLSITPSKAQPFPSFLES